MAQYLQLNKLTKNWSFIFLQSYKDGVPNKLASDCIKLALFNTLLAGVLRCLYNLNKIIYTFISLDYKMAYM